MVLRSTHRSQLRASTHPSEAPEVVHLDGPLTADDVRPGVVFIKAMTLSERVSDQFVQHLRLVGASDTVVAAAEAAAE